jgi:hypothetical protein
MVSGWKVGWRVGEEWVESGWSVEREGVGVESGLRVG